jgi:hypothetical protein
MPQFAGSVVVSTQAPPQQVPTLGLEGKSHSSESDPGSQTFGRHDSALQPVPGGQSLSVEQCALPPSCPWQYGGPPSYGVHCEPFGQKMPHWPQLSFVRALTQAPAHTRHPRTSLQPLAKVQTAPSEGSPESTLALSAVASGRVASTGASSSGASGMEVESALALSLVTSAGAPSGSAESAVGDSEDPSGWPACPAGDDVHPAAAERTSVTKREARPRWGIRATCGARRWELVHLECGIPCGQFADGEHSEHLVDPLRACTPRWAG